MVSHRQGEGKKGVAIAAETLRNIWPNAPTSIFQEKSQLPLSGSSKINDIEIPYRELVRTDRKAVIRCPRCAATVYRAKRYFIDWNDDKKEFQVKLAYYCDPCDFRFEEEGIKNLPLVIAEQSICSCGSALTLSDYSIRKIRDEIELEASYYCSTCSVRKRSLLTRIIHRIYSVWRNVVKVEIRPTGLNFLE